MADINCYGVMDRGFSDELRGEIRHVPAHEPIELHISSPGGMLSEGVTCYNLLRKAPNEVLAYLDGDAFSAATLLVCAADHVEMPSNCLMMIHDPWVPALMPATIEEVTKTGRYLKATKAQVLEIYAERTGKPKRALSAMMKDETYFSAQEAYEHGFVHNVTGSADTVHNMKLEEYMVLNKERLAEMLKKRPVKADLLAMCDHIGDFKYGDSTGH